MTCKKCGGLMTEQTTFAVKSFVCIFCGYAHYPAYPLRPAPANICNACGEEFKPYKNYPQKYCPECRKLIGKNFNKLKAHIDASYAKPWSGKKLEASLG